MLYQLVSPHEWNACRRGGCGTLSPRMSADPQDGRTRRWQGHRARRRAEIVEAAVTTVERVGSEVTVEQIATTAGINRPALYRQFTDREDLERAVAHRVVALLAAELEPVWRPSGTPREMLSTAITAYVRWVSRHAQLYRYVTRRIPAGGDAAAHIRAQIAHHFTGLLTGIDLDPPVATPLSAGLVGLVDAATDQWLASLHGLDATDLAGHLTSWVWSSLDTALRAAGIHLDADRPVTG